MVPIRELLNRIRWDAEFGRGEFQIAFADRHDPALHWVRLRDLAFPEDRPGVFETTDDSGQVISVPLHRIREVRRDGERIWRRPAGIRNTAGP